MSIDKVVLEKIREKLSEKNQSEELIMQLIEFLNEKDTESINLEEKNIRVEKILREIKI